MLRKGERAGDRWIFGMIPNANVVPRKGARHERLISNLDWYHKCIVKSVGKVLLAMVVAGAFLIPMFIATRYVTLWHICQSYVDRVSDLTGLNTYLTSAAVALVLVPLSVGVSWSMSLRSERRHAGEAILLGLFVLYNVSLFYLTQQAYFGFTKGETLKWYALTPDGVQLYDRAGVDPKYGIELKPVTKDVVRQLDLMRRGEFKPIDPSTTTLFNPITGQAQAWFYRYPTGKLEFYDKPGFHPTTGEALQPVTKEIYLDWKRDEEEKAKRQADSAAREEEKRRAAEAERQVSATREEEARRHERERQVQAAREAQRAAVAERARLIQPSAPTPTAEGLRTHPWAR